jgi:hypothetical protein
MNTLILQLKKVIPLCLICALGCLALLPNAQAAPAPETPDPGAVGGVFSTADGQNALAFVTSGVANSAFGAFALFSTTTGNNNTAVGAGPQQRGFKYGCWHSSAFTQYDRHREHGQWDSRAWK